MKKTIFTFCVESAVDLITNSSSELFVLEGNTKDEVIEMVRAVYPDYKDEYAEPIHISEMTTDQLDLYMSYRTHSYSWPASKSSMPMVEGFTFDELYELETEEEAMPRMKPQYRLRNNMKHDPSIKGYQPSSFVTEENIDEIRRKLDPDSKMFFMFSHDENPNWDMQEKLSNIGIRFHLG
jgi:hypothetical protein